MKGLESFLRPEFINRVDEIVYFNPLTEDNFKAIARIMLSELERVLRDKNITFHYDESVLDYLVRKSYSSAYGARNRAAQIQRDLEDPIAAQAHRAVRRPHHYGQPVRPRRRAEYCYGLSSL